MIFLTNTSFREHLLFGLQDEYKTEHSNKWSWHGETWVEIQQLHLTWEADWRRRLPERVLVTQSPLSASVTAVKYTASVKNEKTITLLIELRSGLD